MVKSLHVTTWLQRKTYAESVLLLIGEDHLFIFFFFKKKQKKKYLYLQNSYFREEISSPEEAELD